MWVKVDDGFVEHPKVAAAARHLGSNGAGRVVAVWLEALCYSARNLTDGLVPILIAKKFITDRRPLDVLDVLALPDVRLMKKSDAGYRFHDFDHYQPSAQSVKDKRQRDRDRKTAKDSNGNSHGIRQESQWIPERSRARDPVPVQILPSVGVEQRAFGRARTAPLALMPMQQVRRHLLKASHLALDADRNVSEAELSATVKAASAALKADYNGRAIAKICDAARGQRRRSA